MSIEPFLQSIGLSEKETKIYLSTLKIQPARASQIALLAEVTRPTAYDLLESLKKKGLIIEEETGGIKYFNAKPPESILSFIEGQLEHLQKSKVKAKELLPEFEELQKDEWKKSEVHIYDTTRALQVLKSLLVKHPECKIILDTSESNLSIQNMLERDLEIKNSFNILTPASTSNKVYQNLSRHQIQFLSSVDRQPSDIFIFPEEIGFVSYTPFLQLTLMKNRSVVGTQQAIFRNIWNG